MTANRQRRGAAIALHDVTLGYDRHPAVHHLDGTLAAGSLTAIVGPNGAGKSTLLKGIIGALAPLQGRIDIEAGANGVTPNLAYLPQAAALDTSFPLTVFDLVAMGLWRQVGAFGRIPGARQSSVSQAIAAVGLEGFERRSIGSLSGGQMQRVLFARLLLQDADIILLDEPLTAIDSKTAADLIDLVRRWHRECRTVVAVLHDLDVVRDVFPQTLLLAREKIAWGPTDNVLTAPNMLAARRMIEAFDAEAATCGRGAA